MSRMGRDITLGDGATSGYLAAPASGAGPGVLVLQEWWGLVEHVRDVCDRLAREGFVALAPDLYRGESTSDPSSAERLMMDLELPRAGEDLDAAVISLLSQDATRGARVGCIGFCMGGQLALFAATRNERIGAVVDCYGIHPNVELDLAGLRASVLGIFAENDDFVPPASARKLEADLREAGVSAEFKVHVGVGHAFMNDSRPDAYDAPSARDAWNDILSFLRAELS
jgi:carboxymethylenebutenolidase